MDNNKKLIEIDEAMEQLKNELKKLQDLSGLLKSTSDSANAAIQAAEKVGSLISEIVDAINNLLQQGEQVFNEIQAVDFPKRLDKVDNSVAAISLGIQNILATCQSAIAKLDNLANAVSLNTQNIFADVEKNHLAGRFRTKLLWIIVVIQTATIAIYFLK